MNKARRIGPKYFLIIAEVLTFWLLVGSLPSWAQNERPNSVSITTYHGATVVSRQVLVKFRAPMLLESLASIGADLDADRFEEIGGAGWRVLHSRSKDVDILLAILSSRADVELVEPDLVYSITVVPNDPSFSKQWGLQNTGQTVLGVVGKPGADIKATTAWGYSTGSRNNVIGVLDTGIALAHPDLQSNLWSAPASFSFKGVACSIGTHGFNVVSNTCTPADDNGHGTHVAGIAGAKGNNATGVAGVNWTANLMAIKVCDLKGKCPISNQIIGIEFALAARTNFGSAANVRVLNMSLAGTGRAYFSSALLAQIKLAAANNVLIMAAAGNGTNNDGVPVNNDVVPNFPASYQIDNVIGVAATTNNDVLTSFSNYGYDTIPIAAPGLGIYSTTFTGSPPYGYKNGTSQATPFLSGAAALLLARYPALSAYQIRNLLLNGADSIASTFVNTTSGQKERTVPNGRLNLGRSMKAAGVSCLTPAFSAATPLTAVKYPGSVVAGEFRGKGRRDFAVANDGNDTISIFLGNGLGGATLGSTVPVSCGISCTGNPAQIVLGDFNNDGKRDLIAISDLKSQFYVFLGDGTGKFSEVGTGITVPHAPYRLAVGDFNNDGNTDVALPFDDPYPTPPPYFTPAVAIFSGNGHGGFSAAGTFKFAVPTTNVVQYYAQAIVVGDFNLDGNTDIAVAIQANTTSGTHVGYLGILKGNGVGGFTAMPLVRVSSSPWSLAIADFNGDGKPDLAILSLGNPGSVGIWLGNGLGSFTNSALVNVGSSESGLAVGDFNEDGKDDVAVANSTLNTVSVLLGNGKGGFSSQAAFPVGEQPEWLGVADLNRDGKKDLIVVNHGGVTANQGSVSLLLNSCP